MIPVVGIDPGTLTIDGCGIADEQLYLDRSWPTTDALSDPAGLVELLTASGQPDLIVGPSGYGLPVTRAVCHGGRPALDNLLFVSPAEARQRLGIDARN